MPELMTWVVGAAALLTALGGIWHRGVRPAYRGIRAFMRTVEAAMEIVQAQLSPNGGGSLVDRIGNIETQVTSMSARVDEDRARIEALERKAG